MRTESKRVPTWHRQESYKAFLDRFHNETSSPLLFIGSGASINAGLPNWKELLTALAKRMQGPEHYDEIISLLEEKSHSKYQRAGSLIKRFFSSRIDDDKWRQALEQILNNGKLIKGKSDLHGLIARTKWRRLITTNYDCLIEEAFAQAEIRDKIEITHPWSEDFSSLTQSEKQCIFKIHGDIADKTCPIVLTEEDYAKLYIEEEPKYFKDTLHTLLRNASVTLFIGYSHDDAFVRDLYSNATRGIKPGNAFALVPQPYGFDDIAEFENKLSLLTAQLGLRFIYYSPDRSHQELLEFVKELVEPKLPASYYNSIALRRKPTVIMLYCGGTIGSEERESPKGPDSLLGVTIKNSRFDQGLSQFSHRLLNWYRQSHTSATQVELDIKWEILDPEHQILSENATPETWNAITDKIEEITFKYFYGPSQVGSAATVVGKRLKDIYREESKQYALTYTNGVLSETEFISDFERRYVLGIVLLHGTDTLAYTASALCFGLNNLPCSVVVTGANYPPEFRNVREYSPFYNSSDAWRNLMTSLHFLQALGHRLTELFVCFGDTVHNGINLRKVAIDFVPASRDPGSRQYEEPFMFRNQLADSQYMFKLVDGIFCNNYYSSTMPYSVLLDQDTDDFKDLRHVRWDALLPIPKRKLIRFLFSEQLAYIKVAPMTMPLSTASQDLSALRVLLVEGYESGTYPTSSKHRFAQFLLSLYGMGIPVVLISQNGIRATQQEYITMPIDGIRIPVLRLYGIIAETALPLLSLIVHSLGEEWESVDIPSNELVARRIALLKQGIKNHFEVRDNILSEELKFIVNQRDMHERVRSREESKREQGAMRRREFSERGEVDLRWLAARARRAIKFGVHSSARISRKDFQIILEEIVRPFDRIGAGPDGFAILSDMGFEFGFSLASWSSKERFSSLHNLSQKLLFDLLAPEQLQLQNAANEVLRDIATMLRINSIVNIKISQPLTINITTIDKGENVKAEFLFSVEMTEYFDRVGRDERYHAESFSDLNQIFLEKLSQGPERDQKPEEYEVELLDSYNMLLRDAWLRPTTSLYWFIIGLFKGVGCELAGLLRVGTKASQWWLHRHDKDRERVLRQALDCKITGSSSEFLALHFSYRE